MKKPTVQRWLEQELPKGGLPRSGPEAKRCRERILELSDGCPDCDKIRMKPVKAWAVVRSQRVQGKITNGQDILLVMPTKKGAMKYRLTDDRVARVEIREI